MASNSEIGHAKNIANLNLLNSNIQALGSIYIPSNSMLKIEYLQQIYTISFNSQEKVNILLAPYSIAVNDREIFFEPLYCYLQISC